jgi:hypothetical protein
MFADGLEIAIHKFSDKFASFFDKKILKLVEEVRIDDEVYNYNKKVDANELMFMDTASIKHCLRQCHLRTKTQKVWIESPKNTTWRSRFSSNTTS